MAKIERVHETWSRPITAEYLARQASFGWKLVSVTWEREVEPDPGGSSRRQEDPPYGLRVAGDTLANVWEAPGRTRRPASGCAASASRSG